MDLEFGCEADFIAANAPRPVRSEQVGNDRYEVYRVDVGSDAVEILERPGSGIPALARYYQHGNLVMVLRYLLYETGLPDEPELFVPPPNVRYSEAGQHQERIFGLLGEQQKVRVLANGARRELPTH